MSHDANQNRDETAPVVVTITGAAAKISSLETLLRRLPPVEEAALVVVLQHREALDEEQFREAAQAGGHELVELADGTPLQAGRLHLAPLGGIATLEDGHVQVRPTEQIPGLQGLIDSFLVSLARAQGERSIMVALDGTDGDGTLGAQEMKEAGAVVLAEATPEAKEGHLDASDSPAALADAVLPVDALASHLLSLIDEIAEAPRPGTATLSLDATEVREALAAIADLLRQRTGHDFHGYKPGTFLRRVQRRMQALLLEDLGTYIETLRNQPEEAQSLFNDLLIGVTDFFRDKREWELLEHEVVPRLFEDKAGHDALRVWVAGCSTGEEAYSLAILLAEHRARIEDPPQIQIFASDLDGRALAAARAGRYTGRIADQMSPERLGRWFVKEGDTYHIVKELREMCIFSQHSLIKDAPFSRLDLISCRNLLIYLDADLQERVIPLFHFALRPGGFLFLGNSENASRHNDLFQAAEPRSRIFRQLDTERRTLPEFPFTSVDRRWLSRANLADASGSSARVAPDAADLTRWAERIVERYAPAYVILDAAYTVLHFSGPMGRYLAPAGGAASLNILSLVHPVLRAELRTALGRAAEEGHPVEVNGLEFSINGQGLGADLVVEPLQRAPGTTPGFVVLFREATPRSEAQEPRSSGAAGNPSEHVLHLEEELQLSRDRLQATIEELESTNEELKSSNEEYQSLNEELQSANEELETSKEELQSVNEELITVNGELAHRVQELGRANSDLKNFLESTQIATLFLDNNLRVTNFTPASTDLFHLVESDEGRPIAHIKARVHYDEIEADARRVLRTLAPVEREVGDPVAGAHYMVRVLPYRTTDNFIAGVVVTFVDVTARREAEERLRKAQMRHQAVLQHMGAGYSLLEILFDKDDRAHDMRHLEVNEAAKRLIGTDPTGKLLSEQGSRHERYWFDIVGGVARTGEPARGRRFAAPEGRWYDFEVYKPYPEDPESRQVAAIFQDVTALKAAEDALRASEERKAFLLKLSDALRPLADPVVLQGAAARILGERLDVDRAYYVELDEARQVATVEQEFRRGEVPSVVGEHAFASYGATLGLLRAGKAVVFDDVETEPRVDPADLPAYRALGLRAFLNTPLIKDGALVCAMCVVSAEPRRWTAADAALVEETAERTWAAVERARAEAALRGSEERFRTIVEAARDYAIFTTDVEGRIVAWPSGARQVFGWTAEEVIGQPVDITFTPEDRAAGVPDAERREAREKGQAPDVRWHLCRNSSRVFIDGVVRPLVGPDGTVTGFLKVGQDMTERRATEQALHESEARFRQFGDASADVLWVRDAETLAFEYVSPAFEEIYGSKLEHILAGNHVRRWAELIVPEDRERTLANLRRVREGEHVLHDFRILRSDGQVRWIHDTDFPLLDDEGRAHRIAGIGRDVTDEVELRDRQRVLVAELQHRTRNLMGVVRSLADKTLASSGSLEDFGSRFRDRLNALARVNGLLSRLEEGSRITFDQLLQAELSAHGAVDAEGKGDQVRLSGPKGIRLRSSMVQILALGLHELATNAIKYGALSQPNGRLSVTWSVVDGKDGERRLRVDWRESGVAVALPDGVGEMDGKVTPLRRSGYGRELIVRALPYQLKAETTYELTPEGVRCTIVLPVSLTRGETSSTDEGTDA
ncbi:CheR family methyltransferase [Rubellimicrobium mesophilum]|nr:CheR family methyltransferase [Rubellimicrobium mesophilum]